MELNGKKIVELMRLPSVLAHVTNDGLTGPSVIVSTTLNGKNITLMLSLKTEESNVPMQDLAS